MTTDWLALLTAIIPAILGGGAVGAILTALTQHRRLERIDRVEQLAESQQVALCSALESESRLRQMLFDAKRNQNELDTLWRKRFDDLEARYEAKCSQIEQRAREREEDYLAEIATLRAESRKREEDHQAEMATMRADLTRLQGLVTRYGIDPSTGDTPLPRAAPLPQTGPLKL